MTEHRIAHLSSLVRVLAATAAFVFLLTTAVGGGATPEVSAPARATPAAAQATVPQVALDPRVPLPPELSAWVDTTVAAMSLEELAGQVLMVRAFGQYYAADDSTRQRLVDEIAAAQLGGIILFRSDPYEAAALLGDLQDAAARSTRVPLIIAADFEWGADFRINGAVPYPTAMAVGATFDPAAAEWMGRATARDARALGVHWIFAPVADVNVNPDNPIINVRAFGGAADLVGSMVASFVRGAQAEGVLATAKHFPGHGDTAVDSHVAMPILTHDLARLEAVELAPFRVAIDAGVGSVMTAHMAVPALEPDSQLPATLSPSILNGYLRERMGFDGIIVTDAMEMGGITRRWWAGEAAVEALRAGADVITLPPNTRAVHAAIVTAVARGDLAHERLRDAARAVLAAKARLGLREHRAAAPLRELPERFASRADVAQVQEIADDAVTLLRDREGLLPLDARRWNRVAVVGISDSSSPAPTEDLAATLRTHLGSVEELSIDGRTRGDEAAAIVAAAARARTIVLAVRVRTRDATGRVALPTRQARYARMIADLEVPTIVVALGSPYAATEFADASTVLVSYGWSQPLQRAAARAIVGAAALRGRLPVAAPGLGEVGDGLQRAALDTALRRPTPGAPAAIDLTAAVESLRSAIDARAFPGAAYAIGHGSELIGFGALGQMSYDADASAMSSDSLFDLASLTKVVATTPVAMYAVERGHLRLDYRVSTIVPEFAGGARDAVTVRHLLTHTSGLPAYVEYYRDFDPATVGEASRTEILRRIFATDLEVTPGARYAYSDLGIILLGEVLTRALGEAFHEVAAREIFAPLGMTETVWNPAADMLGRIPSTEQDPWRGRMVRGEVHDENTYAMGGISTHAGLFSTATDLAVYAQTMLNLGTYGHERILRRTTVDAWRRRQEVVADSSRALGWDTAYGPGRWGMFDPAAFGHTGFTGTSMWIDPTRDLFVVLLTNRVHPTRDNSGHVQARIDFHKAIVDAVDAVVRR